jgi:hypothetical protein
MTSFQEFLRKKAQEQGGEGVRRRDEWIAALRRLVDQIVSWLKEDDPEGVLEIGRYEISLSEMSLGAYQAPYLEISLGESEATMSPVARNTVGTIGPRGGVADLEKAEGRVDLKDGLRLKKYMLYRAIEDGRDVWYAVDEKFRADLLDKDRLEAILQDLLS